MARDLLVGVVGVDLADAREADHPGGAVREDHFEGRVEGSVVAGALESTGEPVGMEGRDPRVDLAPRVGVVDLVGPDLGLDLVAGSEKPVVEHDD